MNQLSQKGGRMLSFMAAARCYVPDATLATHCNSLAMPSWAIDLRHPILQQSRTKPPRVPKTLLALQKRHFSTQSQIFLTKQSQHQYSNPSPPAVRCFRRHFCNHAKGEDHERQSQGLEPAECHGGGGNSGGSGIA